MPGNIALGLGVVVTSVFASLAGILAMAALQTRTARNKATIFADTGGGTTFLFDGDQLVDATPSARALLAISAARGGHWARLLAYLSPRFPGFEQALEGLGTNGRLMLPAAPTGTPLLLRAELTGGLTRIALIDPDDESRTPGHDPLTLRAMQDELDDLRGTVAKAPLLMWRETAEGDVTWANKAYLDQALRILEPGQDLSWPLPRVFEKTATSQGAHGQRQRLGLQDGTNSWFELVGFESGDGRMLFAHPADTVVQAEASLREFMQTLTKTFAHLPIGLAIFDRQRQLALFNPALLDLSGLAPDFLSMRPTLFAFLDAMRDKSMIPEPKDYRGWRKQMSELEQAAASGLYEDTWSLPSGQTYKVIGRPHPNGALALMFEDISTEITRIRRYRADLELGQAVVDALEPAIAVFSDSGGLVMSNESYNALWGHDPVNTLTDGSFDSLCAHWRSRSAPAAIWAEAGSFVATMGERDRIEGDARLRDGRLVACEFRALAGGSTLATFRVSTQIEAPLASFAPPLAANTA